MTAKQISLIKPSAKKLNLAVLVLAMVTGFMFLLAGRVSALSGSDFNAGRIMDDGVFYNSNTMNAGQIQNFLNAKVPVCDTNGEKMINDTQTRAQWAAANGKPLPPYICLKGYSQSVQTITNSGSDLCTGSISGGTKSAAQIINDVSKACGVNPQVLIVLLQKEQSLVTDDWPWPIQYRSATGYGCPDTAPCDAEFYGYFNQVYQAAKAYKRYRANPHNYNYRAGRDNTILWHPNHGCGTSNVFIQNQATAGLYIYTPYRPNQAALNNLYGLGDGCSSYGNRNFWRMFNDWFGSTTATISLVYEAGDGSIDSQGDTVNIPVKLIEAPLSDVTLNFAVSDTAIAKITKNSSITFTKSNWDKRQFITIQGLSAQSSSKNLSLYVAYINSPDGAYDQSITRFIRKQPLLWANVSERAVYRLFNHTTGKHAYAVSESIKNTLISSGYVLEGTVGYQCFATNNTPLVVKNDQALVRNIDSVEIVDKESAQLTIMFSNSAGSHYISLFRSADSKDTVLSQDKDEINFLLSNGYVNLTSFLLCKPTDIPIYRLHNPIKGRHFITQSAKEAYSLELAGSVMEGLNHYINVGGTQPVYRLYNAAKETHFYTASASEKSAVEKLGFKYEGVALSGVVGGTQPVYRLYNAAKETHFYTASASEKSTVEKLGFKYEGVAFYRY